MSVDLSNATVQEIAHFYQNAPSVPETWLRANMVISQDGHLTDANGSSRGLSSELDLKVLLTLRAISDAVLVGASTARIENYRPPVLAGDYTKLNTQNPKLVLLSNSLEFDLSSSLFSRPENKPIIFTQESNDPNWHSNSAGLQDVAEVVVLADPLSLSEVITQLHSRNFTKIVCEGGEQLLTELHQNDLVQELDLTISPLTVGPDDLENCVTQMQTNWTLSASAKIGDHLLTRYLR